MALQHLRSSTADKRPTPGAMSDGQLALNTNLVSPGLFFKDSNGDSVKIGPIHVGATAPNATPGAGGQAGNSKGEAWLDTSATNPILKVWNGSAFVAVQPVGTGTVVSTTDTGTVTSTMILDGTIVNADVNASAAIAGTKISPDFGAQNVVTTGTSTAASLIPTSSSVPTNGVYLPAANTVGVATNSVERIKFGTTEAVVNDAGNNYDFRVEGDTNANLFFVDASTDRVGIGTGSPNYLITANSSTTINTLQLTNSSTGSTASDGFWVQANGLNAILSNEEAGDMRFHTSGTQRVTITSAGNCGIGTSSPSFPLVVSSTTNNKLQLTGGPTQNGLFFSGAGGGNDFYLYSSSIGFGVYDNTAASQRLTVDNSGRLLVGTTSGTHQLQVSTDSAGKPSTNTWTIVSDERIKEDIELADLDICYDAIKNIPLKRFKWKDEVYTEEQVPDRHKLGWIAQDVETVFPKAVRIHEFKYNQVFKEVVIPAVEEELDDEGNVITPAQPERIDKGELISEEVIEDCRDLNADQLYAAMYGAIQKLISKVETLEAEITALKA